MRPSSSGTAWMTQLHSTSRKPGRTLRPFVAQIILFGGYVQLHYVSADREEVLEGRASLLGEWCDDQTDRTAIAAYPEAVAWFAKLERLSASPGAIKPFILLNYLIY